MSRITTGIGYLLITLSAICFGSYGIWNRFMGGVFGEFNQAWLRGLLLLVVLVPVMWCQGWWRSIRRSDWGWFAAVGLAGGLNQAPYFLAFQQLPVGVATFLFYAGLVIAGYLVGIWVDRERWSVTKAVGLGLGLGGLVLMMGGFGQQSTPLWPGFLAVLAGVMGGVEVTLTKQISDYYHPSQILVVLFAVMVVGNLGLAGVTGEWSQLSWQLFTHQLATVSLVAYAATLLTAMWLVVVGFSLVSASLGSLVGLSEVIFAAGFGWLVFGEGLSWREAFGGALIVLAAAVPLVHEWWDASDAKNFHFGGKK